jgi:serine/threonine protein kinase
MANRQSECDNVPANAFVKHFPDRDSYRSERDVLRTIQGPCFPRMFRSDDLGQTLYLEHVGSDLLTLVTTQRCDLTVAQITTVLAGILDGLTELHAKGYCHYDLTPRNVCITGDLSTTFSVKLIDFALTFPLDDIPNCYRTQTIGTRSCLSPEHLSRTPEHGKAADVFCAGITTLLLMQGGLDVFSSIYGNLERQVRDAVHLVPTETVYGERVPNDLQNLLKGMLQADPLQRLSSEQCRTLLSRTT